MPRLSDKALSILADILAAHEFTDVEQAQMEVLAEQMRQILEASKQRERQK